MKRQRVNKKELIFVQPVKRIFNLKSLIMEPIEVTEIELSAATRRINPDENGLDRG